MNWSPFSSRRHILASAAISGALIALCVLLRAAPGSREGSHRVIVLASGWTALGLMSICLLYALRKYFYKAGGRFRALRPAKREERTRRLRDAQAALERAEAEVESLRLDILRERVVTRSQALDRVRAIVEKHDVGSIVRPVVLAPAAGPARRPGRGPPPVRPGDPEPGRLLVRLAPREPLGRMGGWLSAHLYYGLAFAVAVLVHGGIPSSPLGAALSLLSLAVILSGVAGIFFLAAAPGMLSSREHDLGLEQSHALVLHIDRQVRSLIDGAERGSSSDQDLRVLLEQRRRFHASLVRIRRSRFAVNAWRVVHIPASILLGVAVAVHVIAVSIY